MNTNHRLLVIGVVLALAAVMPLFALSPHVTGQDRRQPQPRAEAGPADVTFLEDGWECRQDCHTGQVVSLHGGRTEVLGKTPEAAARAFLQGRGRGIARMRMADSVSLSRTVRSRCGYHVSFLQTQNGVPVLGGRTTVHLDLDRRVRMVTSRTHPSLRPALPATVTEAAAKKAASESLGARAVLRGPVRSGLFVLVSDGEARSVYKVEIPSLVPLGDFQILVDARSGRVLSTRNVLRHAEATGRIFDPNPCVTLKNTVLRDSDNSAAAVPADGYRTVTLQGLDGSGTLRGPYVDVSGTTGGPASEPSGVFGYDRSDQRFEQVMVYHHIDRAQRYIQTLGFGNILNRPQVVDAHGTQQDNSWYSPQTKSLTFGDGGVNDAQDADVIMHEYGHAIQDDQVPDFGSTNEGGAMGEGFGDFWASVVRTDHGFHDLAVAIWDATAYSQADPPALRRLDSKKHYPEDLANEVHDDGEMWSACLRQIQDLVGADDGARLVLQSHFFLHPESVFADGAEALLQADRMLFEGRHVEAIRAIFVGRGMLKPVSDPPPPLAAPGRGGATRVPSR